ncbi:MerR family transcriptional regulator [Thermopolyspora sp. NPDC052614]|uniref:MerR family transcriptional regulator n=1 Tax=Thermopolyspora sp. NPDC052614 TaxID=3155682 RepID=UPI0034360064
MTENEGGERRHTIGDVARATGISVRTLHHYDDIGLVTAGERTPSGHRRYTEDDLRKVHRIRALRNLGLSLEDIASVFSEPPGDLTTLRDLLDVRLAEIELGIARLMQVKEQITGLLALTDRPDAPDSERLLAGLESMSVYATYFTQDMRDELARRRAALGEETLTGLRDEWLELMRETRDHAQADTPVTDPQIQSLLTRWDALTTRLRADGHDDERLEAAGRAFWRDYATEISESVAAQTPGLAPEHLKAVMEYLGRARRGSGPERSAPPEAGISA